MIRENQNYRIHCANYFNIKIGNNLNDAKNLVKFDGFTFDEFNSFIEVLSSFSLIS